MYWISPSAPTLVNRGRHYYVGIIKLLTLPSKSCPAELTEPDVGFLWSQTWIHEFASVLQHRWQKKKREVTFASAIASLCVVRLCAKVKNDLCVYASVWWQLDPGQQLSHLVLSQCWGVCHEGHLFAWCVFFISPNQNWAEFPAFIEFCQWQRDSCHSWLWGFVFTLLKLHVSYLAAEEPALIEGKKPHFYSKNRNGKKKKKTKFFWAYSWNFKIQIWSLLSFCFPDSD